MGEQREILKYELDASQVVSGADRAKEALRSVKDGAGAGAGESGAADTSAVQERAEAYNALSGAMYTSGDAMGRMSREGKALVTGVLNMINPALGSMTHLLFVAWNGVTKLSASLLGLGAVGAAIGGIALAFQAVAKATREAAEAERSRQALTRAGLEKELERRTEMEQALRKRGVLGEEATDRGLRVAHGARRQFGVAVPTDVAAQAAAEGITSAEEVAVLAMAQEQGAKFEGPQGATRYLRGMVTRGVYERAREALRAQAGTTGAALERMKAGRVERFGLDRPTAMQLEWQAMRDTGTLPKEWEEYGEFERDRRARATDDPYNSPEAIAQRERVRAMSIPPPAPSSGLSAGTIYIQPSQVFMLPDGRAAKHHVRFGPSLTDVKVPEP